MEKLVFLVGATVCAGLTVLVAVGEAGQGDMARTGLEARSLARRARSLLARLARGRPVLGLLSTRAGEELAGAALEVVGSSSLAAALGPLGPQEAMALIEVGLLAVGVLGTLAFASALAGVVLAASCVVAARACLSSQKRRRAQAAAAEMPGTFRTLSVVMGSGQTLTQAVEYVGAHGKGPVAEAFSDASLRVRCGMGVEEAVDHISDELDAPGITLLATALVIAHRTGSPLRELLLRSARLVEQASEFERLLSVKTAQVRLSVKIVCLMPVLLVALLALISSDFQKGLTSTAGLASLALAAALDALALYIIRRLVKGVLS